MFLYKIQDRFLGEEKSGVDNLHRNKRLRLFAELRGLEDKRRMAAGELYEDAKGLNNLIMLIYSWIIYKKVLKKLLLIYMRVCKEGRKQWMEMTLSIIFRKSIEKKVHLSV